MSGVILLNALAFAGCSRSLHIIDLYTQYIHDKGFKDRASELNLSGKYLSCCSCMHDLCISITNVDFILALYDSG